MTKPSDDSARRINLPNGDGQNFIREKRVDRTATKQIDFSRPRALARPVAEGGRQCETRGDGVGWQETTRGTSPRSIQVFRMRNSRVALHRHFHFRVKLENTGAHTPLHTARARRRERDDRPLVIPYRRFDDRREQRMQRTHTKRPIFRLNIISNSRDDGSENEKKKKKKEGSVALTRSVVGSHLMKDARNKFFHLRAFPRYRPRVSNVTITGRTWNF